MELLIKFLIVFIVGCMIGGGFVYHFINWLMQKAIDKGEIEIIKK